MNVNSEPQRVASESRGKSVLKNLRTDAIVYSHILTETLKGWTPRLTNRQGASLGVLAAATSAAGVALFVEAPTKPASAQVLVDSRIRQSDAEEIVANDPTVESPKAVAEAPSDRPTSEDIICVAEDGKWIVNEVCGGEPIDEERSPGAFVAPALAAAPASIPAEECAPSGSRYGQNRRLWLCDRPQGMPNIPRLVWGRSNTEPITAISTLPRTSPDDRGDINNSIALGQNESAPSGQTWMLRYFYNGQTPTPGLQGDFVVLFSRDEKNASGGRIWYNYLSAKNADNTFGQWTLDNNPNTLDVTDFGRRENGQALPMMDGYYNGRWYVRLPDGTEVLKAEVTTAIGMPYQKIKPNFPGNPKQI